ncbi:hypothetical protein ABW19_dt0210599 [Dactylella cylindrospora]|nr:hypothetical protein ABW19_dt0210599 [Dactylella cylindrospora]
MPPKRMTANPARPARYRAGKPLPGDRSESSGDEDEDEDQQEEEEPVAPAPRPQAGQVISTGLAKVDLNKRFQKTSDDEESSSEDESSEAEQSEEDEAAESTSRRPAPSGDYESEDSDSDSDDTSSEDEAPKRKLIRPTFIPKSKRNVQSSTFADPSTTAPSESAIAARKAEAHTLVESAIRREAVERNSKSKQTLDSDVTYTEPPDDTDDLDPAAERAAWKLRELLRIKRARDAIEQMEKEREEIEARRNMDADERLKEDLEFVANQRREANEKKGKMGFMQKFYHKGAFYQDGDSELLKRNYATAKVEDEVVNRELLPKALQVRSYDQLGKRGRTKWTHLAAEDTTSLAREEGYGWHANKRKGKFEELKGVRDERYMSDKVRERREREREGGDVEMRDRPDRDRPDRDRPDRERDRERREERGDSYRPSGDGRRDDDYRRRDRDNSRDRRRDRSRSPRRDRYDRRDRDYDSRRDGRRSDHDREDRRDDRGGGYRSRWDQQDKPDRKRGGDDAHAEEKRRKIEA